MSCYHVSEYLQLLRDEDAKVRAEAVTGVCRALGSYWQLIPSETINQVRTLSLLLLLLLILKF